MKKVNFFLAKSLIMALMCFSVIACEKESIRVNNYPISPVSKHETGTARIMMSHDNLKVREFYLYEGEDLTCTAGVAYRTDGIFCTLNGIQYHIEPDNILGAVRAKKITATQDGVLLYDVEYFYEGERLKSATIGAPPEGPYYTSYTYYDSHIIINDEGEHRLELCDEENTGYACNVLGYAETPLTTKYVINPALYYLNIYGKPVEKLPHGCEITRSGKTMRVGKNLYEYRD